MFHFVAETKTLFRPGKHQWTANTFLLKNSVPWSLMPPPLLIYCVWEWTTCFYVIVSLTSFHGQRLHFTGDILITCAHFRRYPAQSEEIGKAVFIFHLFPQTPIKILQWLTFKIGTWANYYLIIRETNQMICLC